MEILNFGTQGSSKKKARNRVVLVLGAFALAAVGSTFAASITLNGGSNIQYGQGLQQATACDSSIIIAPNNQFVNQSNSGAFYLSSISIYDTTAAPSSTNGFGNCTNKYLTLKAWDNTASTSPTELLKCDINLGAWTSTGFTSAALTSSGTYPSNCTQNGTAPTVSVASLGSVNYDGVTLTFGGTLSLAASSIYKFTLESHS